jgi:membrane-associated protease RseP (regulator of RpoE activity)
MTDETPQSEGEPSPPVPEAKPDEAPTAETKPFTYDDAVQQAGDEDDVTPPAAAPAAEPDATQAAPAAAPTAAPAATAATPERPNGIFIPKWVGLVAAAIIAALVFGGIGYAIGDSSSDSGSTQNATAFPGFNGNGQVPGYGNGPFGNFPNGNGNNGNGNNGNGGGQTTTNAGFLGVGVGTADNGVAVTEVADGSPAANAGLKQGDVITAIDGTNVTTPLALRAAVQKHSSGDEISVTYTRDGKSNTVKVTLTSRSAQSS